LRFPWLVRTNPIGTRCLADGVLVAPVPTQAARQLGGTIVVGVAVGVHDGKRDAPKNMFPGGCARRQRRTKHQLDTWERHADLVIRPDVNSLAWTISQKPTRPSKPELLPPDSPFHG